MIIAFVSIIGLIFGSFVNALVWRLHETAALRESKKGSGETSAATRRRLRDLSISCGRSICPNCNHVLIAKDLVPLLSWLLLRGRCRYCRRPISGQYPLVELATAALFGLSYAVWPHGFGALGAAMLAVWLLSLVLIMALTVYDGRWQLLPVKLVWPLVGLAIIFATLQMVETGFTLKVLLSLAGAVVLLQGLFLVLYKLSGGSWIGYGDVRLALALGLFVLTPAMSVLLLFIASFSGSLAALPLLLSGKRTTKMTMPFGPYLLLGCTVVVLVGVRLLDLVSVSLFSA